MYSGTINCSAALPVEAHAMYALQKPSVLEKTIINFHDKFNNSHNQLNQSKKVVENFHLDIADAIIHDLKVRSAYYLTSSLNYKTRHFPLNFLFFCYRSKLV